MRIPTELLSLSVNGGVPRDRIIDVLKTPRFVQQAIRVGRCFHCRADDIDVTGLCLICRSFLNDEERQAAQFYYDGV